MASKDEAREAIYDTIASWAPNASASDLRDLAEAWAWLVSPNNSHGGGGKSKN